MYPNFAHQIIHIMVPEFKPRFYKAEHFETLFSYMTSLQSNICKNKSSNFYRTFHHFQQICLCTLFILNYFSVVKVRSVFTAWSIFFFNLAPTDKNMQVHTYLKLILKSWDWDISKTTTHFCEKLTVHTATLLDQIQFFNLFGLILSLFFKFILRSALWLVECTEKLKSSWL